MNFFLGLCGLSITDVAWKQNIRTVCASIDCIINGVSKYQRVFDLTRKFGSRTFANAKIRSLE